MLNLPVEAPARVGGRASFLTLAELTSSRLDDLAQRACTFYRDPGDHDSPLRGLVVGILFAATSTRTRTAFTVGTIRLGGAPYTCSPTELQLATGESLADTARILGAMLDALVIRTTGGIAELRALAEAGALPVVNAMAREEHPTQGVCDVATMTLHAGDLSGVKLVYLGEGNNSATALARALALIPDASATFVTPPGYGLPADILREAQTRARTSGGTIVETHDLDAVPDAADFVYTTRWQTTGTTKADPSWRETFRPYYVDERMMARWPSALFMHDLPAHRGDEVAGSVLDGPRSIAWSQGKMKLASAMAVLEAVASA